MTSTVEFEEHFDSLSIEERTIQFNAFVQQIPVEGVVLRECHYFFSQLLSSINSEKDYKCIWNIIHTRYSSTPELLAYIQQFYETIRSTIN